MAEAAADWDYVQGEGGAESARSDTPTLSVAGFEGPLDFLIEMVRRHQIDLGRLSLVALIDQFVAAFAAARAHVKLERRGDWLVMAATLLQLKAQLLWPANSAAAAEAEGDARQRFESLAAMAQMRAAADWLARRPRLGVDVFPRGSVETVSSSQAELYVAFLEATLVMLEGRPGMEEELMPAYQPVFPDLWRVQDALARIRAMLAEHPQGGDLVQFLPAIALDVADRDLKARAAVASTFVAGLELAREGVLQLSQDGGLGRLTVLVTAREHAGAAFVYPLICLCCMQSGRRAVATAPNSGAGSRTRAFKAPCALSANGQRGVGVRIRCRRKACRRCLRPVPWPG